MLGIRLWLLQMVWPSGSTSAMSASTTALLELAAAMLSRLSASGWAAISATAANLCAPASAATTG